MRLAALVADADDEWLAAVRNAVSPDFIQLHGRETPARTAAVRARLGIPLIKAIAVADAADFETVPAYASSADMFLFDAKAPDRQRPGGHGVPFDWQLLRGRKIARPWFLAGGLNPDNVARAAASANAPGVDVSSGVETAPGLKSPEMIAAFVAAARNPPKAMMEAR